MALTRSLRTRAGNKTLGPCLNQDSVSFWQATCSPPRFKALTKNVSCDVVVVGAGIAGLTIAYTLCKEGKKVVILDDKDLGMGETGRTTAHIVYALDDRYYDLKKMHGLKNTRLAAESHKAAIDYVQEIVLSEKIDCDFKRVSGYLFLSKGDSIKILEEEQKILHQIGFTDVELIGQLLLDYFDVGPCLIFPGQAQFHPLKYLYGLARTIRKYGGEIYTNTRASTIDKRGVQTLNGFTISAQHIVVATNTPVNDRVVIHSKQVPYRTYVIGARIPRQYSPKGLFWDTSEEENLWPYPYHYVRSQPLDGKHDLLIVGGEDHKTGYEADGDPYARLETWSRKRFPAMKDVEYRWSGQVLEPVDSLAFIGRNPADANNVYVVTGDSGNGMTHGTIAGILIPDLINGRKNPWEKIYDPRRRSLKSLGPYLKENLKVAKNYLEHLELKDRSIVGRGQGAVISHGKSKVAVFRDDKGDMHEYSAVCPHLKCVVHWNEGEKTFDCPCHGSRFTCQGKVINGPALSDLSPVSRAKKK